MAKQPRGKAGGTKARAPAKRGTAKRPPAKRAATTARKAPTVPETGPVTLEEARALVAARRARRGSRKSLPKTAEASPSPAPVGLQRKELEKERDAEIAQRVRDYAETMRIMKERGARAPRGRKGGPKAGGPKGVGPKGGGAGSGFAPLQILAEGDSWFDYPVPFFGGGVIPRLQNRVGVPILSLAKAGDEVRYMLGVKERKVLAQHLLDGSPAGGGWDVLLFSGGGNDIVDNPMALWVRDFQEGVPPAELVHWPRFEAALALVRAGYEDLIEMRDRHSPDTHLVFHGYDFALADGRGACGLFGPWLKPTFDLRGFPPDGPAARGVVKAMLLRFAEMLTELATRTKVTFVNGQGTLPLRPSSWDNELHPSSAGFDRFATLFHAKLRELFPERVA